MKRPDVSFSADYVDVLLKELDKAKQTYIQNEKLREMLYSWYDACVVDVKMEGPICHGVRINKLQNLYLETCKVLDEVAVESIVKEWK